MPLVPKRLMFLAGRGTDLANRCLRLRRHQHGPPAEARTVSLPPQPTPTMSLRLNDTAPNFTAETTCGPITFHDWIGNGWALLFSHPKDFTPVCTTELGYLAKVETEFTKRQCKLIGLSVDPVE